MNNYQRVEDDDPRRCQGQTKFGQCTIMAVEGSDYCRLHGGACVEQRKQKLKIRNLRLTKYKAEIQRLGNSDHILNLRDEIAVLRMVLEKHINNIASDSDMLLATPAISDLCTKIERTVASCYKIEERTGQLLSIEQLGAFAIKIIDVVNEQVKDPTAKEVIAKTILTAVQERDNS